MLSFALAISYHLNAEQYNLNSIHPHVRYTTEQDYIVGAYLNSESNLSTYAGVKLNDYTELGLVTGYDALVYPYLRLVYDGFFVTPSVYELGNAIGIVVGYELGF